jgi:hypothetical protein
LCWLGATASSIGTSSSEDTGSGTAGFAGVSTCGARNSSADIFSIPKLALPVTGCASSPSSDHCIGNAGSDSGSAAGRSAGLNSGFFASGTAAASTSS